MPKAFARYLRCATLTVAGFSLAPVPAGAQTSKTLSLDDAIGRALEANGTIAAARAARGIGMAGVRAARQRPNPEVSVEGERETPHWSFGTAVPLELGGKRRRRVEVAQAELAVTDAETARVIAEVRGDVRRAYYQAVAALRRLSIAQELETIASRARSAADDRFKTGASPRLESLQAQLALAEAQNDVSVRRGEITAARSELNALLAYPLDAAPALTDPLDAGALPTAQEATGRAVAANAELQVLEVQIKQERARVELARAMRRPDPILSGTLTYDSPPDFTFGWRAGVAVSLPIFTTGRADVAVAEATLARAVAERDARSALIAGAVSAAIARADAARQTLRRYETEILPASLQVEQMAQESYQSGQTGLAALLQTVQAAREVRLRALQAGVDYQLAIADLERAMGTPRR